MRRLGYHLSGAIAPAMNVHADLAAHRDHHPAAPVLALVAGLGGGLVGCESSHRGVGFGVGF
jgi:hypothetical protein